VDLIRRYYNELWDAWDFELAHKLLSPDFIFRGSLGKELRGREAFKDYMRTVRNAFSDFHNQIEQILRCETDVITRLTYTGTHDGPLFGIPASNRRIAYPGIAIFRTDGHWLVEGYALGDRLTLLEHILGQAFWANTGLCR
jgi:steroid delta-isomerase-like uncharacterized protein